MNIKLQMVLMKNEVLSCASLAICRAYVKLKPFRGVYIQICTYILKFQSSFDSNLQWLQLLLRTSNRKGNTFVQSLRSINTQVDAIYFCDGEFEAIFSGFIFQREE